MKSIIVRIAVLSVATAGFAASTLASKAASVKGDTKVIIGLCSPAPMCAPSDPSHCGMH